MQVDESFRHKRFGRAFVVGPAITFKDKRRNRWYAVIKCDCGGTAIVRKDALTRGVMSCGCLQREAAAKLGRYYSGDKSTGYKHGGRGTRLYGVWRGMLSRCNNKNATGYHNYGGRGVTVCSEWIEFPAFLRWSTLSGYRDGVEIDRIDNNGNYEPTNCRWSTIKVNSRNRRTNRLVLAFGETKCMTEWSEDYRARASWFTIQKRLDMGWPPEKAISLPARKISRVAKLLKTG